MCLEGFTRKLFSSKVAFNHKEVIRSVHKGVVAVKRLIHRPLKGTPTGVIHYKS